MHTFVKSTIIASVLLAAAQVDAFGTPMKNRVAFNKIFPQPSSLVQSHSKSSSSSTLTMATTTRATTQLFAASQSQDVDSEVERLKNMAAKLRAEAAALEAQKAQENANATQRAFDKFDTNHDGQVTLHELKSGLEKVLKTELKEDRVKQLLEEFDASGDGALQLDEFVSVEQFKGRLDAIIREEQAAAKEAVRLAKAEKEAAMVAEAKLALLNDKAPTNNDKLISIIPYLFPLMDGLQFGRFLLEGQDNPVIAVLAVLFTLYRSIPFGGFIAFFALNVLTGNLGINKLVRYNAQQAIYLDIALFLPGLIASLYTLVISGLGVQVPEMAGRVGSDVIFVTLLASIGYSVVSSLLGETPDKLPVISNMVKQRMPTLDMLDETGRFIPPRNPSNDNDDKKDNDKK